MEEKKEEAKVYLAVKGKPKIGERKVFNLILPLKLAEAVDAHTAGVRNTIFSVLIAKGLDSIEEESSRKKQTVTIDAEELLKSLKYIT